MISRFFFGSIGGLVASAVGTFRRSSSSSKAPRRCPRLGRSGAPPGVLRSAVPRDPDTPPVSNISSTIPNWMMSPGLRIVSSEIGPPFTVVPLALPRSRRTISRPLTTISAWRRLTESSSTCRSTPGTRPTSMVPESANVFPVTGPVNPRSCGPVARWGAGRLASAEPAPPGFTTGTTRVDRGAPAAFTGLPFAVVGSLPSRLPGAGFAAFGSAFEPTFREIS